MERKLIAAAVSSALALPMAVQVQADEMEVEPHSHPVTYEHEHEMDDGTMGPLHAHEHVEHPHGQMHGHNFAVHGQVARAIISVDGTGADSDGDLQHVDSNASGSRFGFTGSKDLDSGMTAGVHLEYGLTADVRHANVYLDTVGGKITVGHGSFAADGMAFADLGGPSFLGGVSNSCTYYSSGPACPSNDGGRGPALRYDTPSIGPFSLAFSTGNDDYWDVKATLAGSFGDAGYDIRIGHIAEYDKPAPVAAVPAESANILGQLIKESADEGTDTGPDTTFTYKGKSGWRVFDSNSRRVEGDGQDDTVPGGPGSGSGAITVGNYYNAWHYGSPGDPDAVAVMGDITTVSAAVSFGQGTSVAVAWSQDDVQDHEYRYVKLDHSYGDGSIGVYYKTGEYGEEAPALKKDDGTKMDVAGQEGSLWGVGIGHNLGGGATAYAGFRQITEDDKEDIDLLVAGMRVTFN